jgi:tRNA (guanine-N7-)-methyltransferase
VFDEWFLERVAALLRPGGELHFATDVEEYFGVMRRLLEEAPAFRELPVPEVGAPESDLDYLTNFERKYRIEGRAIFRGRYAVGAGGTGPA